MLYIVKVTLLLVDMGSVFGMVFRKCPMLYDR